MTATPTATNSATPGFKRARLIPFANSGSQLEEQNAIPLDFNPETLTLKISTGESKSRGRRGNQQIQNVSRSNATLSFDCIFDSTRPPDVVGGGSALQASNRSREISRNLDVRRRTSQIAALIQVQGSGQDQAPRKVRFQWGQFIFDGTIKDHQEVFDYFSPDGVPLRSKITITITENNFRYEVTSNEAKLRRQRVEQGKASAKQKAADTGADSLLASGGTTTPGANSDLSLESVPFDDLISNLDSQIGLNALAGGTAKLGALLGGGQSLDLATAIDVFGPQAVTAALLTSPTLSASASLSTQPGSATAAITAAFAPSAATQPPGAFTGGTSPGRSPALAASAWMDTSGLTISYTKVAAAFPVPSPGLGAPGRPNSPWAPEGPAPGSRGSQVAAVVAANRARGLREPPTHLLPIRGQPPLSPLRLGETPAPLFSAHPGLPGGIGRYNLQITERRPAWERVATLPKKASPEARFPFLSP